MYCFKCGHKNNDGAQFCEKCGEKLTIQQVDLNDDSFDDEPDEEIFQGSLIDKINEERKAVQPNLATDPPADKRQLLSELNRLYQYFSKVNQSYRHLVDCSKKLEALRGPSIFKWLFGGLLISLVVYLALVFLVGIDLKAGFFILWLAIAIGGIIVQNQKFKKDKRFYENNVISINYELVQYYNQASNCCIAYEYSDPAYMQEIIKILNSGRAETLGNAINIMLDDIQKGQILQQQILMARQANQRAASNALLMAAALSKGRRR